VAAFHLACHQRLGTALGDHRTGHGCRRRLSQVFEQVVYSTLEEGNISNREQLAPTIPDHLELKHSQHLDKQNSATSATLTFHKTFLDYLTQPLHISLWQILALFCLL